MPKDLSDKKKPAIETKSQKDDWRPPVGTRVEIVEHGTWKGFTGVVDAHEKWMSMITLSVKIDGAEDNHHRAGITAPNQIRILEDG